MQFLIVIVISFLSLSDYGQKETQLDWAELRPILKRLKLTSTTQQTENYRNTWEIEEADAKAYGPVSGVTLFLKEASPAQLKPRYWMRVEDYSTAEAAFKRAAEYWGSGETYKRLDKIPLVGIHPEKDTLRLWAVARGKRVYALTTDALVFERISLPKELKAAISKLPEK
jgi:hypothetical protein